MYQAKWVSLCCVYFLSISWVMFGGLCCSWGLDVQVYMKHIGCYLCECVCARSLRAMQQNASSIFHNDCFSSVLYSSSDNNVPLFCVCPVRVLICVSMCRYNGSLPNGDRGRRKSRFALCKRPKANGVKPSTVHVACSPQAAKVKHTHVYKHTILSHLVIPGITKQVSGFSLKVYETINLSNEEMHQL